ncbi:uncharacterized mitochondrial protein AtMg00810-like [Salvia splendens]|uniref:uncharacterized mitochondrial protein AtMg00810-like n=1 Tax=Salvia splendens TaxID=180675 RepID=UPI001C25E865|nr:uncharacterized mitochondrial protein AtMg00810-like [Salvia splendens]
MLETYVDDMIITGDDKEEIEKLKEPLAAEFEMKNLGDLKYFLGIELLRSSKGIFICQMKYILDLLTETGMLDCKLTNTPIVQNHGPQVVKGPATIDRIRYQRLVGKLIYLCHTRPNIVYVVGILSQFMHRHLEEKIVEIPYVKSEDQLADIFTKAVSAKNIQ